ncbi:MAG: TIGR04063 family PEP-CTERM/XrtA system glycosyltransferase [Casimicrobiaceae bacterium]
MRILHVLDHSIPLQSGYTFRTLSILREQRRRGWQTFQLTSPKHHVATADQEDIDGWSFYRTRLPAHPLEWLPAAREMRSMRATERRLGEIAAQVRPDVIHAHSPVLNGIPALRVGERLGIPVVYEVRAFWEDAAVDHGTTREWDLRYRLTRNLETYALRRVAHVTTICEGLKREIVHRGVPGSRVTVIPNAVDSGSFRFDEPADAPLKQKLGLEGRTVIGFIGSFYAYEGLDLLMEALPRVVAVLEDVRLLLVGGGPHEAVLRSAVARLGLDDKVVFTGRVPHGDVHRYYSIVDICAYPRHSMRLTELVTPLKPLEAMAQGRLLVASDVGGHRELIRDGETGVLFRAGDAGSLAEALLRLLAQRERWPRLRTNARHFVETERTWARSVEGYGDVYAGITSRVIAA